MFYRNAIVLESFSRTLTSASELFIGRQFVGGITAIRATPSAVALVDDTTWGLTVTGLLGNYDFDAADYALCRKHPGSFPVDAFATWRTKSPAVAGASVSAVVSEPATPVLLLFAAAGWCLRRSRTAQQVPRHIVTK